MMATLDNLVAGVSSNLRSLSNSVGAAPAWVVGLTGVPFLLAAGTYAFGSLGLSSMEPATATALFNGATGVGGFATMLIVSKLLESEGGTFHFAEVLPSILGVGLAGLHERGDVRPERSVLRGGRRGGGTGDSDEREDARQSDEDDARTTTDGTPAHCTDVDASSNKNPRSVRTV